MKPRLLTRANKLKSFVLSGAALCMGVSFSTADEIPESQLRDWKSRDGNYTVRATFVSFNSFTKQVTLQKDDSSAVKVPLAQLSPADRSYVEGHAPKFVRKGEVGKATKLYGISWQPEIEDALTIAAGEATPADDRPVMWFRVLGELDGGM